MLVPLSPTTSNRDRHEIADSDRSVMFVFDISNTSSVLIDDKATTAESEMYVSERSSSAIGPTWSSCRTMSSVVAVPARSIFQAQVSESVEKVAPMSSNVRRAATDARSGGEVIQSKLPHLGHAASPKWDGSIATNLPQTWQ